MYEIREEDITGNYKSWWKCDKQQTILKVRLPMIWLYYTLKRKLPAKSSIWTDSSKETTMWQAQENMIKWCKGWSENAGCRKLERSGSRR